MKTLSLLIAAFCLLSVPAFAQVPGHLSSGIGLQDESSLQGRVNQLNCVGPLISCTSSGLTGTLTTALPAMAEVDGHTDATLSAANCTNTVVYNTGQAAADVALTLPAAAAGLSCLFTVATAQSNKWGVRAAATDKIYLLAADGTISAGSDNGYARMTAAQVGQSFACWSFKTDAYDWLCKAISIGTSTFAAN